MRIDLANLPSHPVVLHRLVRDMAEIVEHSDGEIERLRLIIRPMQRAQFGRRSATSCGTPDRTPLSTPVFFTHSFSVCAAQPILAVIDETAVQRDECSLW